MGMPPLTDSLLQTADARMQPVFHTSQPNFLSLKDTFDLGFKKKDWYQCSR